MERKKTIFHYSHCHELSFFIYRMVREEVFDCFGCEKHLLPSEVSYDCRLCNFYLHQDRVASGKIPSSPPSMENKALFVEQNEGSNVIHTLSLFRHIIHTH
ncbi:uncharacterized protein [Gossypium hirsutum]|uniref:Uncharacterized protein n=1 Tax=Gossypium hirsutum TaxID=3635 RepID=A0ABM2YZI1_GOSHI|nr:uncharacterized protein LOC121209365 [Gossypium hirsutum]